jgi:hypothetical protein
MPAKTKRPSVESARIRELVVFAREQFGETIAMKAAPNRLFFPYGITSLSIDLRIGDYGLTISVTGPNAGPAGSAAAITGPAIA